MSSHHMIKRIVDVLLASWLIAVLAPAWLLVAAAVRLSSRGPVLYRGERVGRDGHTFSMYKFRTMGVGADRQGPAVTGSRDPRVTSVGRILRATKLDELPQLLNVLRGEMSLVGPRPEAPRYVALYDERQRRVLSVRPGMTGPTQLLYRNEESMLAGLDVERQYTEDILPRKLELDLQYVDSQSLLRDLQLLYSTARRVTRGVLA